MTNPFSPDLFQDRVAVITGGGTGIGLGTALMLAKSGAKVTIASRRMENLDEGHQRLQEVGADHLTATCDIREPESTQKLVETVMERYGRLDILVNNAGGQFPSPAEALSPNGWNSVVRNNLTGTWNMIQAASVVMIPAKSGTILNVIADIHRGFPGMVHTGAARAGVENLTKTLAVEWATHNIRINSVAPGIIRTPAISKYGEELVQARRQEIPTKRLGTITEVAATISFLVSPAAAYITGETLYVDGGARLWGRNWPIDEPSSPVKGYGESS